MALWRLAILRCRMLVMNILASNLSGANFLLSLLIIFVAAKLFAEIFERFGQPAVVGEILAGIIIGPSVLGIVSPTETISTFAEIGVIFLLFTVGLETKPQAILKVGGRAFIVAIMGVILPFIAGYFIALYWDGNQIEAMFVGAAMVATSVGITARVLGNLGLLDAPTARIILGAAVIDDILGLLILSVVSGLSKGSVDYFELIKTAGLSIIFTVLIATIGAKLITKLAPNFGKLRIGEPFFIAGLILCLGFSFAATFIGVAAIIGAFLAGMALAEATEHNHSVHKQTSGVMEFFVPVFLVNIGMSLDLQIFRDWNIVLLAVIVTLLAIVTKFIGCAIASYGIGWRRSVQIGVGMVPRGEVGIVVAQIGLSLGVISGSFFASVLFMAIATTLIAPPFIKLAFANEDAAKGKIDADDAGGILTNDELSLLG
jgi:Kef-type K+ transport system membrane component KefB